MIFDHKLYKSLVARHGRYGAIILSLHWSIVFVVAPIVTGVIAGFLYRYLWK